MNLKFDLVIVGAGPAGCTSAFLLANQGLNIAVIEKSIFPRDKICGDALSPDVTNQLRLINPAWADQFLRKVPKQATGGIRFVAPNFRTLDIHLASADHSGSSSFIAKRYDFDKFLFDQIKDLPGIHVFQDEKVEQVELVKDGVIVKTDQQTLNTRLVLGADGANSIVSRQLSNNQMDKDHYCAGVRQYFRNVKGTEDHNCIELHFYRELLPGYFWIFALPNHQVNVGMGMLSAEISRKKINLKEKLKELVTNHPNLKDRFEDATPLESIKGFGLPIGSRKVTCSGERFLLLGDAAHLIDPFTGEGIGNAIRSGRIAAEHLKKAFAQNRFDASFNKGYDREIYHRMWRELRISRSIQKLSRYPGLFNFIVSKASTNESIRILLTSMLSNVDLRNELRKPSFYLKLLFR